MLLRSVELDFSTFDNYVQLFNQWPPPPPEQRSRRSFAAVLTTEMPCCTVCQTASFGRSSRSKTPPHVWSLGPVDVTTSRWCCVNCTGFLFVDELSGSLVASGHTGNTGIPSWRHPTCDGHWSPSATFSRSQDMLCSTDTQQFRRPKFQCRRPACVEQPATAPTTRHELCCGWKSKLQF